MPRNRNKRVVKKDSEDEYDDTLPISDESGSEDENNPINEEIIFPGLVLKGDYILLKKIGYGNNAGVWMTYQISSKSYLAIKIQDNECYEDGCREVAIIKKINAYARQQYSLKDKADSNKTYQNIHCVKMLDYFVYEEDDKTRFVCSVYDLYAGSIFMVLDTGKHKYGLPIDVVKTITKQLLTALIVLHHNLRIIHTDIKPENILFKGTPIHHLKIIELFTNSGFQQKYEQLVIACAGNKKKLQEELEILASESVKDICNLDENINDNEEFMPDDEDDDEFIEGEDDDLDESGSEDEKNILSTRRQSVNDLIEHLDYTEMHDIEDEGKYDFVSILNNRVNGTTTDTKEVIDDTYILNCETALTDFGNAYFYEKRTRNEIQDRRYRAPEIILDFNYGFACDMWSVGCVVFELLTGFALFAPERDPLTKDIHHLFLMEKMLGPLPLAMKKKSKRCRFLFDPKRNYHIKNAKEFNSMSIKERLVKQFLFSETDAEQISNFLLCTLKYNPSDRMTAKDLINHQWLN